MAKEKILVTGATGTTGRRTVETFGITGARYGRRSQREPRERAPALSTRRGFCWRPSRFSYNPTAFDGIGAAYFCYPLWPCAIEAATLFAQAAIEAEVSAIVNISQICARRESKSHAAFNHWIEERLLDRTGIPTTHFRPTFFAEWFIYPGHLAQINNGHVRFPFRVGTHAPIAGEDQARMIAAILESPEAHAGKTYDLCGPEEHSHQEWIARLSNILGREVRYEVTSDDETREIFAGWYGDFPAQHVVAVAKDYNSGLFSGTDEVIEKVTGKKPMSFDEFIGQRLSLFNEEKARRLADPPPKSDDLVTAQWRLKRAGRHDPRRRRRPAIAARPGKAARPNSTKASPYQSGDRLRGDLSRQSRPFRGQCRVAQHRPRFPRRLVGRPVVDFERLRDRLCRSPGVLRRLAERHRRDLSFLASVALFTAASAACAMANSVETLVAFRIAQAAGAALMTPTSLGLLLASFPAEKRAGAVRAWTAIGGFAAALGPWLAACS